MILEADAESPASASGISLFLTFPQASVRLWLVAHFEGLAFNAQMILLEALGDFHDTTAVGGVVRGIAGRNDGADDVEVGLVVEVAVAEEAVDGVADLLDGVLDVNTFQLDEEAGVFLGIDGMMAEEIVALVVSDIGVEVTVNLVLVDD